MAEPMGDTNHLLEAALAYAARGWPVFPCAPRDKMPLLSKRLGGNGLYDATTDTEQVAAWWKRYPTANIGLRTGVAFDVLDIDGADGTASIIAACEEYGFTLPGGPWSKTGGGGDHVLFVPTGAGNRAGLLYKVDWRGAGGYIVAPPSVHPSGNVYAWDSDEDGDRGPEHPLEPVPDWLATLVNPPKVERGSTPVKFLPRNAGDGTPYGLQAMDRELEDLARSQPGSRNSDLNTAAFNLYQLVAGGELLEVAVEQRLRTMGMSIGLSENEVMQTIRSGRSKGVQHPRSAPELVLIPGRHHSGGADATAGGGGETEAPVDADIVDLVRSHFGVDSVEAVKIAEAVIDRTRYEKVTSLARRLVRDEEAARDADLDGIVGGTAAQILAQPRPERRTLLGDLVHQGHNVTITARYKVGKSTLMENVTSAAVTAGLFLARFPVQEPHRVMYLNYELDADDMDARLRSMQLPADALEQVYVLNLRGHRLPLLAPSGRNWLVSQLTEHGAGVVVVDPFGAAYASAGGESENDNAEVRRFLTALDEIKRLADCHTLFMPVHTGRGEQTEGDERARGATVLDDWADVRIILTRDDKGHRFVRTEGRALDLEESRLGFDAGRLMLATSDMGVNRRRSKEAAHLDTVVAALRHNPGVNTTDLRGVLAAEGITNHADADAARDRASTAKVIHSHQQGRSVLHYVGAPHGVDPCPEGWKP